MTIGHLRLKTLDLLGPSISLQISRNNKFKTLTGAIITIIVFLASIGAFFAFGSDLLSRTNPRVTFNKLSNSPPEYIMTDNNFLFSMYDQYTNIPYEESDRKFTSVMEYLEIDGPSFTVTSYEMTKCSDFTLKKWNDKIASAPPDSYRCLPKGLSLKVFGIPDVGKNSLLRLQVNYCTNTTAYDKCYPYDFIQQNITGRIQMNYLIESSKVDSLNYDSPVSFSQISQLVNTNTKSWTRSNVVFKNIKFISDQGFFTKYYEENIYQAVDTIYTESVYTPDTTTIFSHLMGNSEFTDTYTRNYLKIQEIFAMMGGFINAALLIGRTFVSYITRPDLVDIFNKKFKYEQVNPRNESVDNKLFSTLNKKDGIANVDETSKRTNNYIIENTSVLKNKVELIKLSLKSAKIYEFKMNFPAKLLRCLNFQNRNKIFYSIQTKILKTISYENITKISLQQKILKFLVLENYQSSLMKFCSGKKPEKNMEFNTAFKMLEGDMKLGNKPVSRKLNQWLLHT
jgi:hypothetical protein